MALSKHAADPTASDISRTLTADAGVVSHPVPQPAKAWLLHGLTSKQRANAGLLRARVTASPVGTKPRDDRRAARHLLDDQMAGQLGLTRWGWEIRGVAP